MESGIHLKESGTIGIGTIGIRGPSSTGKEYGIQYLESVIYDTKSSIQDCLGFP